MPDGAIASRTQVVTLSAYRFEGLGGRAWALGQMLAARRPLARLPGIGFRKQMGTGTGEGFNPAPNTAVWTILAAWETLEAAREAQAAAGPFADYRGRAAESLTLYLRPISARGAWDGHAPFEAAAAEGTGAMAVLTRASVRPRHILRFWRHVPNIERMIALQDGLLFKMGMGEVPWLHQVTFSVWDDVGAMTRFARRGFHNAAIQDVRRFGCFREELYARFSVLGHEGAWADAGPLPRLEG